MITKLRRKLLLYIHYTMTKQVLCFSRVSRLHLLLFDMRSQHCKTKPKQELGSLLLILQSPASSSLFINKSNTKRWWTRAASTHSAPQVHNRSILKIILIVDIWDNYTKTHCFKANSITIYNYLSLRPGELKLIKYIEY